MQPPEWALVPIDDIGRVIRGASPRPKKDPRFYGGKVPRLMVEDVTRDGKYVTPVVDSLTELGASMSRRCKAGTLTVVCSGDVGTPSFLKVDACIHDGFLAIVDLNERILPDFLFNQLWWLKGVMERSATHGGIFTNLTTQILREFSIPLPPLAEQRKIAAILSTWDQAIELTEQLIAAKECRKQALMQRLLTGKVRFPGFNRALERGAVGFSIRSDVQ